MESNAFFMSIDIAAQYFICFVAMIPVRSVNASAVETPFLKPNCDLLIILFLIIKSIYLDFKTFLTFLRKKIIEKLLYN